MKREDVKLLLVEGFFEPKNGQFVADKTGVPMKVVSVSVGGDKSAQTWFDVMENLVRAIESAAKN